MDVAGKAKGQPEGWRGNAELEKTTRKEVGLLANRRIEVSCLSGAELRTVTFQPRKPYGKTHTHAESRRWCSRFLTSPQTGCPGSPGRVCTDSLQLRSHRLLHTPRCFIPIFKPFSSSQVPEPGNASAYLAVAFPPSAVTLFSCPPKGAFLIFPYVLSVLFSKP